MMENKYASVKAKAGGISHERRRDAEKQTVVFGFDGVIHSYISGWKGVGIASDPPVEGIREAIHEIRNAGYKVVVVSTRCRTDTGSIAVSKYLRKHDIHVDSIEAEKPPAIVYIDDRAICFDGKVENLLEQIQNFQPWTKKIKDAIGYVEE